MEAKEDDTEVTPTTFMEKLMQQPEYIKQYYAQIDFHTVPAKIYEYLKATGTVYVATDGGAIPFKGSLGFVLADAEGTIYLSLIHI